MLLTWIRSERWLARLQSLRKCHVCLHAHAQVQAGGHGGQACHWLDVEIISLDLGQKLPFRLRPKLLAAATARG
eukprot:1142387-Pelagomonas_calceolata.AAC.4